MIAPLRWISVWGPGLLVMLADTDAGNVVTGAQAGAKWGYCHCCCSCSGGGRSRKFASHKIYLGEASVVAILLAYLLLLRAPVARWPAGRKGRP
jgi:hypothetical protein